MWFNMDQDRVDLPGGVGVAYERGGNARQKF